MEVTGELELRDESEESKTEVVILEQDQSVMEVYKEEGIRFLQIS